MATTAELEAMAAGLAAKGPEGPDAFMARRASNRVSDEGLNTAWWQHLNAGLSGVATDPTMAAEAPIPGSIADLNAQGAEQTAQRVAPTPELRADLNRKMAARDAVSVGGLFFGGPAFEGAGVLGAAAGAVGRLAGGASIGAGLGLSEGLLGGYDPDELPKMAKDYAQGALMFGIPLEGIGAGIGIARNLKFRNELKQLANQIDGKIRSSGELHEAIVKHPEVAKFFQGVEEATTKIKSSREELVKIGKEVRGAGRTVTSRDIEDSPGLHDFLFNQLKAEHPDLSPNAEPEVLWNLAKKAKILPSRGRVNGPRSRALKPIETPAAESARAAYEATIGAPDVEGAFHSAGKRQGAVKAARAAAYNAKGKELEELLNVGSLRDVLSNKALDFDVAKGHRYIHNMAVKRVSELVKSGQFFGEAGPVFGNLLHEFSVLREGVEGHWTRIVQDHVLHGLNKAEKANLNDYLRWNKPAENEKVLNAAKKWIDLRKVIANDATGLKLQAKDRGLTEVFRKLKPEDKAAILKLQSLPDPGEDPKLLKEIADIRAKLSPEAAGLHGNIERLGGKVTSDRGYHVERPFQESGVHAPDYYKPELLDEIANNPEHPVAKAMYQQILNERPDLKHPATGEPYDQAVKAELKERLGLGGTSAPDYIWNNGLQWSRESIIDPKYRIEDPETWMTKYAHAAASRLSAARTFGANEEKFHQIYNQVATQTGDRLTGKHFSPMGYGEVQGGQFKTAPNLKVLEDVYDMAMGRGKSSPKALRQLADATLRQRIGYTTFLKQFSSLKNVAAVHGVGNTLDAMYQVLRNPKMRQLSDDVGATLSDLVRVMADDTQAINPSNPMAKKAVQVLWGKSAADQMSRTGTLVGDRFTRRTSAIAAGLKARQAQRDLQLLGSKSMGERMRGEQARRWLENMDVDVDKILQRGLTDAERRQIMLSGARNTQFTSQVEDLPALASTTVPGRALGLLNKFSYQQGPFVIKSLLKEAAQGNLKPIIGFGAFMAMSDRAMASLLQSLSSQKYDVATDIMIDSMFGKFGSVAADAQSDPQTAVLRTATGPIASLAVDAASAGSNLVKAGGDVLTGQPENVPGHLGKALWNLSPATVRQLIYMMQSQTGTK